MIYYFKVGFFLLSLTPNLNFSAIWICYQKANGRLIKKTNRLFVDLHHNSFQGFFLFLFVPVSLARKTGASTELARSASLSTTPNLYLLQYSVSSKGLVRQGDFLSVTIIVCQELKTFRLADKNSSFGDDPPNLCDSSTCLHSGGRKLDVICHHH